MNTPGKALERVGVVHFSVVLDLLRHAIQRTVERGGLYRDIRTGISRGCPLNPLPGALYLQTLDERLGKRDPDEKYYVR